MVGTCVIIENNNEEFLVYLRDKKEDKPSIPYPNTWCFLGGKIEEGESAEETIVREIKEETTVDIPTPKFLFSFSYQEPDHEDRYAVFYLKKEIDVENTPLFEGQKMQWFPAKDLKKLEMGYYQDFVLDLFLKIKEDNLV